MKEFIKNKYNIIIPALLIIVLGIALFLYGREYKNNKLAYVNDIQVYQYFSGVKMEYKAKISRNRSNVILDFDNDEFDINLDSTPIYISDSERNNVIFPKEMAAVYPISDRQYRVNALAEIYKENDLYYLNIRGFNEVLEHAFLYDGKNLYFFPESTVLTVGDRKIELSPMSYVSCSYLSLLEYYDREKDVYETIELSSDKVTVSNDYMTVDVASDKVIFKNSFSLLPSDFSVLSKITEKGK